MKLTNEQARTFLLRRHGLTGPAVFTGKEGVMDFIRRVGCIQYDPVDVCGRNADITLFARVEGYTPRLLDELLYKERRLIDFFDKNLSIFPMEDWPALGRKPISGAYAEVYDARGGDAVQRMKPLIQKLIEERGSVCSKEIEVSENITWHWGAMTSLPRAALESMYFNGELIIHHKTRTHKHYAFAKDYIPADIHNAPYPFNTDEERLAWMVKRRVGAVGLLWNKASDAWLGMKMKAAERVTAFERLIKAGEILEVTVEGIKQPLYARADETELLEEVLSGKEYEPRAAFIAPLDCFMWDRKLIEAIFGFVYKWEIYTPAAQRKYGAYTLPFLYGGSFPGRAELVREDGKLVVKNLWRESERKWPAAVERAFKDCTARFAGFNSCVYDG
jgi:hypothetical protein